MATIIAPFTVIQVVSIGLQGKTLTLLLMRGLMIMRSVCTIFPAPPSQPQIADPHHSLTIDIHWLFRMLSLFPSALDLSDTLIQMKCHHTITRLLQSYYIWDVGVEITAFITRRVRQFPTACLICFDHPCRVRGTAPRRTESIRFCFNLKTSRLHDFGWW